MPCRIIVLARAGVVAAALAASGCAAPLLSASEPADVLPAPRQVSPAEGAVLTFFPRLIDFQWGPVPGAARYTVEVDCYHCCARDAWCSAVNPQAVPRYSALTTRVTSDFPGDQPGRWRVWAVTADGRAGASSDWRQFTFYRPSAASAPPSGYRDPSTGQTVNGPGVVGARAVYSPPAVYPQSALADRMTGVVTLEALVTLDGRVGRVSIVRSLRADLDDAAIRAVQTWRFEPARLRGEAVPSLVTLTISFNLQ